MSSAAGPEAGLEDYLRSLAGHKGSDLHITAGSPPRVRVNGRLRPLNAPVLTPETSRQLAYSILTAEQIAVFEREQELDAAFGLADIGRFRVNVFRQRGAVGMTLRLVPNPTFRFEDLGLPVVLCQNLCRLAKGLVLVTGATGSGKSTTLAAMVNYINENEDGHILTLEDPIEFLHKNKRCLVNQREVGPDTHSFSASLRHVLRQDPDTVLIGEMRDIETIEMGLRIAETGHLTFATLHTSDAVQTVNRVIDMFPAGQQSQIRTQLSFVLEAVLAQQLIPKTMGGRCLAMEVMIATSGIRANIRDDKVHHIYSSIQTGSREGMVTMNASLAHLVMTGHISRETALHHTVRPDELEQLLSGARARMGRQPSDTHW